MAKKRELAKKELVKPKKNFTKLEWCSIIWNMFEFYGRVIIYIVCLVVIILLSSNFGLLQMFMMWILGIWTIKPMVSAIFKIFNR